ncbi:MAG TPA: FAD-binding dehydrogenase [Pseudogracilibacillus sp.]|nr:FAD-binding dehydrogenase [Pseudogracilibacillus sp.]
MDYDAIVVGAGLAGLVATTEIARAGKKVLVVDQEGEQSVGGQAWWSFGGLFLVNSPEQRRMGIKDSKELAWQDWQGTATYDRQDDFWGKQWAKAYVDFATYEKRDWLYQKGVRIFPVVGWAERGGYLAEGHGNSVPRFHITWGTGPGIVEPFAREMKRYIEMGIVTFLPRHRVDSLVKENNRIAGIHGTVLETDTAARGEATNRNPVGEFTYFAQATVITTGGIGADFTTIRKNWPTRLGRAPQNMISGVPEHVDGRMLEIAENTGANLINRDRMWHYTEGIKNWNPIWKKHGIRILPGPSSMWLDALGNRFSAPNLPGFDTLGTLETIMDTGYDYSWFILTKKVIEKEFALSGSEQNPDLTGKSIAKVLQRIKPGAPDPVQAFLDYGEDFVEADSIDNLVIKMNQLTGENRLDIDHVRRQVAARDRELINPFSKDIQITAMHGARRYVGDKLIRTAKPHAFLDRKNGPLIAVRLHILSRKTLGGLQTDLQSRVLKEDGTWLEGLYAAGEVAGFGGGGLHGYRSLEGTFLGGCLFSGKIAGEAVREQLR